MITDKVVYVTYTDGHGQQSVLEMTLTGKQIEQTMLRRMATLMPNAKGISVDDRKPDAVQLPISTGSKK